MSLWLTPEEFYTFVILLTENTAPINVDYLPIISSATTKYIKLETLKTYFSDGIVPTFTSELTNNGSDGVNPFITALDIPTTSETGTIVRQVKNMTGATLVKGTVVFISGANGNKPLVSKAIATTDALSARTFGLLQSNILNNGVGNCVVIGDLSGLDTSSFTEGDQLYLSGTVAGGYTSTRTLAPTHLVYIGKITRSHPTLGQIEVQIQNGYELEEIHDVQIISVANNQILYYDSATSLWKNKTLAKADVGLSNVDNTSDANKPVSTATQTALDLRTRELLQNFTAYTTTGVLTEQIISNQAITASDMKINSWLNFIATLDGTGTTNRTVAIYLSTTSNSIVGAVKIATVSTTSAQSLPCFKRDFSINASSVLRGLNFTANAPTDEISTGTQSTTTLTLTSAYYLITTVVLNNVADTVTQRAINLKSSK
jgi:hypothetical protein